MPLGTIDSASLPVLANPDLATALAGVNTPLGGFAIVGPPDASITAILAATAGALTVDIAPGATVRGGGSHQIWIAGTVAQVNAKLATLVYASALPGLDGLTVSVLDAAGRSGGTTSIPVDVQPLTGRLPEASPPIVLTGGTLSLEQRTIAGLTIDLETPNPAPAPAIILVNTTFAADATLNVGNAAGALTPRVAIAGRVELDGTTRFASGSAQISLAIGATLINQGRIDFIGSSAVVAGAGLLRNDGLIQVTAGSPAIDTTITGAGVIALQSFAHLTLAGPVGEGLTIQFAGTASLELDDAGSMNAGIAGFAPGDDIALAGIAADAIDYADEGGHGVLTLYDGANRVAALHFDGTYRPGDFRIAAAADTATPTLNITVDAATIDALSFATPAGHDVYRFFDTVHGTELLTQDRGEKSAILATRPDLVYEGVAMQALDGAGPTDAAVYRFFDTAHGTHFLTASATERDSLIASRPDLVYEPGSTMFEHAAQKAGDVPVYRFFDTITGAHFYTADASERAILLSARPDMAAEGIAFYAPHG